MRPMAVRIWRTGLHESRAREYEDFARNVSLSMFRRQAGLHGVLFAGSGAERVVITLWESRAAVAAMEASGDYQATVRAIEAAGFLRSPQRIELFDLHGSWTERLGQDPS